MDQPGKVANQSCSWPAEQVVRAREFCPVRQIRPSRPGSACSFSTLRLNLVLTNGISATFRDGVHLFIPSTAIGSVSQSVPITLLQYHSLSGQAVTRLDGVHYREFAGTGPVIVNVVPVTGAAFAGGHHGPINVRLSFPHPLYYYRYVLIVGMLKILEA